MIDPSIKLEIFSVNSEDEFTDHSLNLADLGRDSAEITLDDSGAFVYVGFYKPFNATYVELAEPSEAETPVSINAEYFNGTEWVPLPDFMDSTLGLTRSAFLLWDRNAESWSESVLDGVSRFWIRLKASAEVTASLNGVTILFSDDNALQTEFPRATSPDFLIDQRSHVQIHVGVRDQMIQELRNKGWLKIANGQYSNLTPWDVLDVFELKQAAICLALSKIFFNASSQPGDMWEVKSKAYEERYKSFFNLATIALDMNDDGVKQETEQKTGFREIRLVR